MTVQSRSRRRQEIPPDDRLWGVLFTLLGSAAHDLDALCVASTDGHVGWRDRHERRGSIHLRVGPPAGLRTSGVRSAEPSLTAACGSARVVWRSGGYGYVPTRAALDRM